VRALRLPVGRHLDPAYKMPTRVQILAVLALLAWAGTCCAQEPPAPKTSDLPAPSQTAPTNGGAGPCVQPAPMVRLQDYDGPLQKTVGFFTGKIEGKTVHPPHYKPGLVICTLDLKDKFMLFVRSSYDPGTILNSAFNAGLSQARNDDRPFGQGMAGYGKRFAATYSDMASFEFFKDFAYPTIFSEDPRYYRLAHGSGGQRFLHAVEHAVVAHRDNGKRMFNFSEWLGTTSAISLGNMYHPGNRRGFSPTARGVGFSVLNDMGFDILREFWPEIAHKFKLPFRQEPTTEIDTNPAVK
jgi:hypothetical protein